MNVAEIRDDLPRSPEASEFPQALAAMERMEETLQEAESQAQWTVGDAVLHDIPIQPTGVKDGSHERLKRLAGPAATRDIPSTPCAGSGWFPRDFQVPGAGHLMRGRSTRRPERPRSSTRSLAGLRRK